MSEQALAFWNSAPPVRTPRLYAAVENAYRVFGAYELRRPLIACHCDSCLSEQNAEALLKTPLRQIPARLLAEYSNSAHGYDPVHVAPQLKYFLPRYLDLVADGQSPHPLEPTLCLNRLGQANWRNDWPAEERCVIDAFFSALLALALAETTVDQHGFASALQLKIVTLLGFVLHSGGAIAPLLAEWQNSPDPAAALHVANFRIHALSREWGEWFCPALFHDFPDPSRDIAAWMLDESWSRRIEAAFFLAETPGQQRILSIALG